MLGTLFIWFEKGNSSIIPTKQKLTLSRFMEASLPTVIPAPLRTTRNAEVRKPATIAGPRTLARMNYSPSEKEPNVFSRRTRHSSLTPLNKAVSMRNMEHRRGSSVVQPSGAEKSGPLMRVNHSGIFTTNVPSSFSRKR